MVNETLIQREDRPAYVRFEREPIENKKASLEAGRSVSVDVDYVYITAPYGKDEHPKKITAWLEQLSLQVQQGQISPERREHYLSAYRAWQSGQEMPLSGVPIKGWGILTPAMQQNLIAANIRTVEDLAQINDEGQRRIGMGAIDLRTKAQAWLSQLKDKGPLTVEIAAAKQENAALTISVQTLTQQVEGLTKLVQAQGFVQTARAAEPMPMTEITASDILDEEPGVKPGRRK